jgi:prepilin-type N-terminal cleavage/methylation domain-containing protein
MVKLRDKVKGSTLIEVLVAMIILVICLGIATIIILNISKSGNTSLKLFAEQYAEQLIEQSKINCDYRNVTIETEGIIIEKQVKSYKNLDGIAELTITVFDTGMKQLVQKKELVILE